MMEFWVGEWTNWAALITELDFYPHAGNFAAGTRIVLYGSRDI